MVGSCESGAKSSGYIKCAELTEDLLPSQEGLSYLDRDWIHPQNSLTQYDSSMSPPVFLECLTHEVRGPIG